MTKINILGVRLNVSVKDVKSQTDILGIMNNKKKMRQQGAAVLENAYIRVCEFEMCEKKKKKEIPCL